MARLEDLIRDIADPGLRNQIVREVSALKARKKFGLVFEEHLPEIVQLPGLAIKPGARVISRKDKLTSSFVVTAVINGKKVSIVPERGGPEEVAAKDELVVVKRFGEPMYPALVPIDRVTRAPGKPYHTLINADNFHALQLLLYCYEGRVDVIYIDPPYNTGARDWKYNNDYVDKTDSFRHSKWLSMMKKRLTLAKRLLKPEGIMVLTIDDYEVHHVRMLIEHEIPGMSVAGAVVIKTSPSGRPTLRGFRTNHEYALFVVTSDAASISTLPRSENQTALFKEVDEDGSFMWANLRKRGGANTLREARPKQFYPIYVSGNKIRVPMMEWNKEKRSWTIREAPKRNEETLYPMGDDGKERIWSLGHETLRSSLDDIRIVSGKKDQIIIQRKVRASEEGSQPSTLWEKSQYSIVEHGTVLLERILGSVQAFPFPKSIYAVADCLRVAGAGLKAIVNKLEDPDSGSPVRVDRKADLVLCTRAKDKADLFSALEKTPTYVLDNTRRQANTRRLLSLARKITMDGIDPEAWGEAKTLAVETLKAAAARLRKNPEFTANVSGKTTINVKEFKVEFGEIHELKESRTIAVEVTPENIDDLFTQCETILGEGLKDEYWRRTHEHDSPDRAKLELFCILQDSESVRSVQEACGKQIDKLFEQHRDKIEEMPSSRREQYARIGRQGADPRAEIIHMPELIELRKEAPLWSGHLFVDDAGKFGWNANSWEDAVLREEMKSKNFAGWLRNIPKKHWSLCVPYGQGQAKPMYPDMLVFRRESKKIKFDILEPHDDSRGDAAEKAAGLANFARKHGAAFGRIEMIRLVKGKIERLRLHEEAVRDKVAEVSDLKHLSELYDQFG